MADQMIFLLKVVQNIETIKFDFFNFLFNKYNVCYDQHPSKMSLRCLADSPITSAKLSCSIEVMLANNE